MIQSLNGGMQLSYVDDKGNTVTVPFNDFTNYNNVAEIMGAQRQAITDNNTNRLAYLDSVTHYNVNVLAGRPASMPIPTKPLYIKVTDTGARTSEDFNPPLPNVATAPTSTATGILYTPTPVVPTSVEQGIMNALMAVSKQLTELRAALVAKGVI